MVLLKNFLLFGVALVAAIPTLFPAIGEQGLTAQARELPRRDSLNTAIAGKNAIEARDTSRMTLQWSPQGRLIFLCGLNIFPESVLQSLYMTGQGGPGKILFDTFYNYVSGQAMSSGRAFRAFALVRAAIQKGGVYGKGTGDVENTFGIGLQTAQLPDAEDLQILLEVISDWAGGLVQVVLRPNNFFDLAGIGAGPKKRDMLLENRSRTNQCPAVDNILQYATIDVPDIDINRDIRWAGECDQ